MDFGVIFGFHDRVCRWSDDGELMYDGQFEDGRGPNRVWIRSLYWASNFKFFKIFKYWRLPKKGSTPIEVILLKPNF